MTDRRRRARDVPWVGDPTPIQEAPMLYLVIAKDGTDPEAPARRQQVREAHLVGARKLAEAGTMHLGGALLDDAGAMIGSAIILEADDEAAARALLEADIYHRGGVWRSYEIYPFRRAV
ncbi:MAG: YciI family protein [Trueperaceae bacterium]|nr:YciI family protein [Trueperaceae bacterium]